MLEVLMSLSPKLLKSILKTLLITFGIVAVLTFLAGFLGAPGMRDFEASIINGYEYVDAGAYERMITNREGVVIDSRVDSYKVVGDKIIVARRPREIFYEGNQHQAASSRLSGNCEYWVINTKTHRVEKSSEVHGLHCD